MDQNTAVLRGNVPEKRSELNERTAPAKENRNNPATVEAFDREHMGIAPKE